MGAARGQPGPALPGRARHAPATRSSTPSSPAGCSATSGSASARWSRGPARADPGEGPLGRRLVHPAAAASSGCATPRWTSRCSSSCATLLEAQLRRAGQAGVGPGGVRRAWPPRRPPAPRAEPWRRTSGIHRVRSRRQLAAVRALWEARDALARQRDIAPGRVLPDTAIVAAATGQPGDRGGARRAAGVLRPAAAAPAAPLVRCASPRPARCRTTSCRCRRCRATARRRRTGGPTGTRTPPPGWPPPGPRWPSCPRRLSIPVENLLTPDLVRRLAWSPPATRRRAPGRGVGAACSRPEAPGAGRSSSPRRLLARCGEGHCERSYRPVRSPR